MVEEISRQTVKYAGVINVLRQYPDQAYNTGEVNFVVEGPILSIPALPLVMLNLKENAKAVCEHGWRFNCGKIQFFVPGEQMQIALQPYLSERRSDNVERFLDPYGKADLS